VLCLVIIRGFGEFDHLVVEALRRTDVEADHQHSSMVRRFDLLDAISNLLSKPVSACQQSRRAAAQENHHNTDESNQREVKCAVIAEAAGAGLHYIDGSTNIVSRTKHYAMWTDLVFGRLVAHGGIGIGPQCDVRPQSGLWYRTCPRTQALSRLAPIAKLRS
jgi:hypothetical protein